MYNAFDVVSASTDRLVQPRRRSRARRELVDAISAYLWIAPAVVIIGVFHFLPVFYAAYISLHRWGLRQDRYLGLANYERALTDGEFWNALAVTLYYVLGTVPVALVLAFVLAALLFQPIAVRGLFRTIFFLPYVTSTVAAAMVFGWLFHNQYGVVNVVVTWLGLEPRRWLLEPTPALKLLLDAIGVSVGLPESALGPSLALTVVILFAIWHGLGFDVVVFLAGLSNIPREIQEAARLDGASGPQVIRHVVLPLLSPTILFLTVVATIRSFQAFNQIYVLTNGGPLNTTRNVVMLIFQNFYQRTDRVGYAAAVAIILFAIVLAITLLQLRLGGRRVHYG